MEIGCVYLTDRSMLAMQIGLVVIIFVLFKADRDIFFFSIRSDSSVKISL